MNSFSEVIRSINSGEVNFGLLPIENSIAGTVVDSYEELIASKIPILSEYMYKITHSLIGLKGTEIRDILEVHSHPQALKQCKTYINKMGYKSIPVIDTGGSVHNLKEVGDKRIAAIAGEHFENDKDFVILKKKISDNEENYTRFLLIGTESIEINADEYKTSTVLISSDKPGSLLKGLQEFASLNLNLTKLESRPILGRPWEYKFYIDFSSEKNDQRIEELKVNLDDVVENIQFLGTYPIVKL
jgi:prephenate dehydratase